MKRTATIILNRNLPEVTDRLCESLMEFDGQVTDVFVVESGSSEDRLSKYCSWWANWDEALTQGLRYARGFNYGLTQLWKEGNFSEYEFFFLVCNDAEFDSGPVVQNLMKEMDAHPRLGILSPCSERWGERKLLGHNETKYFWYVQHIAWMMRREFIESLSEPESSDQMDFLYDGSNFRGYGADLELIAKGYANDWATGITSRVRLSENEDYLKTKADLMKTDAYDANLIKVFDQGKKWLRRKYGFNSRWMMQVYLRFLYDRFFVNYPEYSEFSV